MNVLALETSCEHASVALLSGGQIVERRLDGHANHSEHILACIGALLAEAGLRPAALDAIAFGSGPGAFTGLRLSCGIAQGLALGAGLGVAPVCSLDALALQGEGAQVVVATDARMGEIYHCAYRLDGGVPQALGAIACSPPEAALLPEDGLWCGVGSAFAAYRDTLRQRWGARLTHCFDGRYPRAADVARLAGTAVAAGALLAPELALPRYVRDKVALTTAERLARGGKA